MEMEITRKQVAGDWFDIKEDIDDINKFTELLGLSKETLRKAISDVHLSVEEGIIEYKRKIILEVYSFLEKLKYDSKGLDLLKGHIEKFSSLTFLVIAQRLLINGKVHLKHKPKNEQENDVSRDLKPPDLEIKEIISDVKERIKRDPSIETTPEVKNIFIQVKIYSKELTDMKALQPNIPADKAQAFFKNFKNTFAAITAKIHANYALLLQDELKEERSKIVSHPLVKHDLSPAITLYMSQIKIISEIRSTLLYAENEKYKTREILSGIQKLRGPVLSIIEKEKNLYEELTASETNARNISRAFCPELIHILEKEINWIK